MASMKPSPFRFHGWLGKRLTASFGWNYDFDTARFAPTEPIPDWLCPLRKRAAQFACLEPNDLVQALLIRYDPGAGIGWRRDRPVFERMVLAPGNPPAKHAAATVPMPTWPATLTAEHHRITQHAPEYGIHQRIADEAWVFLSP